MKITKKLFQGSTCNICSKKFRRKSVFARFCDACRKSNEIYRFADYGVTYTRHQEPYLLDDEENLTLAFEKVSA